MKKKLRLYTHEADLSVHENSRPYESVTKVMARRDMTNIERFYKMLAWAKEANVYMYGPKNAELIARSFSNDQAEIISLAARDIQNRIIKRNWE